MYELLRGDAGLKPVSRPDDIEYHRVFDTVRETGETHFLHGPAVDRWNGSLTVCFAYNDRSENSVTEQLLFRRSEDNGMTWTRAARIAPLSPYANSHSVFLSRNDALWCFGPRFMGLGEPALTAKGRRMIHFMDLRTEAWRYDGISWKGLGIVAEGFWPLSAPVRMDNGNWLLAGCDTNWYAAAAISRGDDLLHWDVVRPDTDGEVFTEAGAWVSGSMVFMVMRNESVMTDGKYHAAYAISSDYGRSFGPCSITNLPMAASKPFCGRFSDGRPYLVFNASTETGPRDRSRMLLGVGYDRGGFQIDKLYLVDDGAMAPSGRRLSLSYPYAKEIDGKRYIAYSYQSMPGGTGANHNDAMLPVVSLSSLSSGD